MNPCLNYFDMGGVNMLPNFIVIGAAKCGTTSICELLRQHPDIFMSQPKEPHFFGRNAPEKTLEWYENLFSDVISEIAIGEGSTSYTHPDILEEAASGIAELIPQCRLIYMVRNPVKRLESDWKMRQHEGWAKGSINEAVFSQPTLISHGMYWQNLSVYLKKFSHEQILVIFLEDFIANPMRELKRCCRHIGVESELVFDDINRPRNKSSDFRKDGLIATKLRRTVLLLWIKGRTPRWLIKMLKKILTKKQDISFSWEDKVRAYVIESLREDSAQFLKHFGKSQYFWEQ